MDMDSVVFGLSLGALAVVPIGFLVATAFDYVGVYRKRKNP